MEMTIRELREKTAHMDPDAKIRIGGGHIEYATSDIELVEGDGEVMIQESSRVLADDYDVIDLAGHGFDDSGYGKLVLCKSYRASLTDVMQLFDPSFSGDILVDMLYHSGNNSNRFIKAAVTHGEVQPGSFAVVGLHREEPLRRFSNDCVRRDAKRLELSVLSSAQKALLLSGVSI